jgi:hypothetical protein
LRPFGDTARRATAAAVLGSALFLAACALPVAGLFDRDAPADVALYESFGRRIVDGEVPYRDFFVEYPPGALPAFVLPSLTGLDYPVAFKLTMVTCFVLALWCLALVLVHIGASDTRLYCSCAFAGLAPLALGPTFLERYDAWPAALASAALVVLVLGRARWAHATLALATAAKVYPILMLPVFLLRGARSRPERRRLLVGFAVTLAVVLLPFVVLGPGGIRYTARVQLTRPLQVESLGGSFAFLLDRLGLGETTVSTEYGSQNVHGGAVPLVTVLVLLALLAALAATWILFASGESSAERAAAACACAVTAFVAFGKVLSPQYLVWLVPLAPLAFRRAWIPACSLLLLAMALTRTWFPGHYGDVAVLGDRGWVVLGRNAVLALTFGVMLRSLGRTRVSTGAPDLATGRHTADPMII